MYNMIPFLKRGVKVYLPIIFGRPRILPKVAYGYFKTLVLRKPVLKSVEFSVTARCNSKCIMCFSDKYLRKDDNELSPEEYREYWKQARKLGAIGAYLIGGEPTVRKDLFQILEVLEPKKYIIGMVSNALRVSEDMIKRLKEIGLSFITFSLDGTTKEINDSIRGIPGHFDKVMQCLKWAQKYGLKTEVGFVVSHSTLKKLPEMLAFIMKSGANTMSPSVMVPVGKWEDNENEILTDEDWIKINELNKKYPQLRFDFNQNYTLKQTCPGGIEKLCISPYGDVLTCSVNPLSFGNVRKEPLEAIWRRLHKFPFFKLGRDYERCVVASDYEYHKEFLDPIIGHEKNPVSVFEHPNTEKYSNYIEEAHNVAKRRKD